MKTIKTILPIYFFIFVAISIYGESEEKVLTIPYSRQLKAYSCGQNSFRMVMGYWGVDLTKAEIFRLTGYRATTIKDFERIVEAHFPDFEFRKLEKNIESIKKSVDENRPVFIQVNAGYLPYLDYESAGGHYIVALGYNREKEVIYVRDPNSFYVEAISYKELQKAWGNPRHFVFSIYKKDGVFVKPENIKHYSQEAKPFGAEKEERKTPLYAALIPSVYTVFNTSETGIKNTSLLEDWLYTVKIQGLYFGHLNLERAPWVYQQTPFYGIGGNLGFDFGRKKLLFGHSDTLSPGVYRQLRQRTLDPRSFDTIKRIPSLTLSYLVLEVSGYANLLENYYPHPPATMAYENPVDLTSLVGGRLAARYGLGQIWGYLSLGGSVDSVKLTVGDKSRRIYIPGGDVTIGPLEGSFRYLNKELDGENSIRILAFSGGLNLNLPQISGGIFTVLNFIGLFRTYYNFNYQEFRFTGSTPESGMITTSHSFEFPMSLWFLNLIYGFDFTLSNNSLYSFDAGGRLLFNQFLPYFQLQAGYKYTWNMNEKNNHALHLGVYAGLW